MARVNPDTVKRGWCYRCNHTSWPATGAKKSNCYRCGERLTSEQKLPRHLQKLFRFQSWEDDVWLRGLGGTTPGGAAAVLGCSRVMVIKLCRMDVLERTVYDEDGYYGSYISFRSIERALENKKTTGKWTGAGAESYRGYWDRVRRQLGF